MRTSTISALAAAAFSLGLSGAVMAQQQGGQTQNMQGMDHSKMQGMDHSNMQGMDHSNMPGMRGSTQSGGAQGARAVAPGASTRPETPSQRR